MVRTQANVAREVGAERLVAVATAAIRSAPNRKELCERRVGGGRHAAERALGRGGGAARLRGRHAHPAPAPRGHDRGARRGRRVERDRGRRARRQDGLVGLLPDRLRVPRRLLPALRPALRGRAGEGPPARGGGLRGARAAAGRQRRGGGRHGHVAAPAGRRGAVPRDPGARHPRAVHHAHRRGGAHGSSSTPSACACCRPASSCSRRCPTCSSCRCASRAEACARACSSSWWRAGSLPRSTGERAAIAASSDGRRSTLSSPRSTPASPPFFSRTCAPVSACTADEKSGSWPTSSTSRPPARPPARRRGSDRPRASARAAAPRPELLAREPRRIRRTYLRARQAGVELHPQRPERGARRARLLAALLGERALGVRRPVCGIAVPQQPDHRIWHDNHLRWNWA